MARPRHTRLAGTRAKQLRRSLTIGEADLWAGLKNRGTGARFRRQVPIGIWIADFASLDPKLVVEVDDESHDWRDETVRDRYMESVGFTVLRFTNREVSEDPNAVLRTIAYWVECLKAGSPPPDLP